jgi:CheY-like chemotaxis protein
VQGDQVRLSQIVANLLINAAKFTEPNGTISLTAEVDNDQIVIRISDNGIGIESKNINNIFDLFTQSGHVSDRIHDGLGIGLSLVRELVKLHNGKVNAHSKGLGLGSVFEITLPIDKSESNPSVSDTSTLEKSVKRVLIVDDNEDGATSLAELLEFGGHHVETAFTGAKAIEAAIQFNPDIILLDIGLPDFNGYEVASKLRALPNGADFMVIALTGYGQDSDRKAALSSGFDGHFVKPVDFKKLESIGIGI